MSGMNEAQVNVLIEAAMNRTHGQLTTLIQSAQQKQAEFESKLGTATETVDRKTEYLDEAMGQIDVKTGHMNTEMLKVQTVIDSIFQKAEFLNKARVEAQEVVESVKGALANLEAKI